MSAVTRIDNPSTRLAPERPPVHPRQLLRGGFLLVEKRIRKDLELTGPGCVVAAANPWTGETALTLVPVPRREIISSMVVGRHGSADLVIRSDPRLSLRHAIILFSAGPDGEPVARILDLRSGTGMVDSNQLPHYSVASNGPVALCLGGTTLFVVPPDPWTGRKDRLVSFEDIEWPTPVPWVPSSSPEEQISRVTTVTGVSSVVSMFGRGSSLGRPQRRRRMGKRVGTVRFEMGRAKRDLEVDEVALTTGVLVGRYSRCDLHAGMGLVTPLVSRVHALFIKIGERVHVFDTGSSNGLSYNGFRIYSLALPAHLPSELVISRDVSLSWWPG
jgi:hypothetical protein